MNYFESKGCSCKCVTNGSQCLEELKMWKPKVILLDIILNDISGYELCKTIKSQEEHESLPIYYFTAINDLEVEKKLDTTKAYGYILKPFEFLDLEVILDVIKKNEGT